MLELAVAQLGRRGCLALSEDMTGREALQRAESDRAGRRALGELVLAVEVSLFGGRALGREDHERCAAALRRLASPGPAAGAGGEAPPPWSSALPGGDLPTLPAP